MKKMKFSLMGLALVAALTSAFATRPDCLSCQSAPQYHLKWFSICVYREPLVLIMIAILIPSLVPTISPIRWDSPMYMPPAGWVIWIDMQQPGQIIKRLYNNYYHCNYLIGNIGTTCANTVNQ